MNYLLLHFTTLLFVQINTTFKTVNVFQIATITKTTVTTQNEETSEFL